MSAHKEALRLVLDLRCRACKPIAARERGHTFSGSVIVSVQCAAGDPCTRNRDHEAYELNTTCAVKVERREPAWEGRRQHYSCQLLVDTKAGQHERVAGKKISPNVESVQPR